MARCISCSVDLKVPELADDEGAGPFFRPQLAVDTILRRHFVHLPCEVSSSVQEAITNFLAASSMSSQPIAGASPVLPGTLMQQAVAY